jgi:flagellin-like protein
MSNRYLNNKTKAKKGISPVIATVILVAVAVVIAAALAGFSSSLFGSYSQNSQIQIRSMTVDVTNDAGTIDIVNKGGAPETVTSISATGFGSITDPLLMAPNPATIPANGDQAITFAPVTDMTFVAADAGKTVTFTVQTASGQSYTLSTVLQ